MKPIVKGEGTTHWYSCGICCEPLNPYEERCPMCGTEIDWEGEKE